MATRADGRRRFSTSRELFAAARGARRDSARIRGQLAAVGPSEVRGQAARLRERDAGNTEVILLASRVLWGAPGVAGLASYVTPWWCDVIEHHWMNGLTWQETAYVMGFSEQRCRQVAAAAFDACDARGIVRTMSVDSRLDL